MTRFLEALQVFKVALYEKVNRLTFSIPQPVAEFECPETPLIYAVATQFHPSLPFHSSLFLPLSPRGKYSIISPCFEAFYILRFILVIHTYIEFFAFGA